MPKTTNWPLAVFLILGLAFANANTATAAETGNSRTIGGYIYSWVEWAMSIPRGLFLATDNEVVMAQAELVSDIQKLKATVARTGFEFESISVGMDLIPSISLGLSFNRMITDQERAQLNAEMQGDKFNILERALIDALLDAASVKIGGDGDNLVLSGADVDVDLIPSVTLTFEDDAPATVKN